MKFGRLISAVAVLAMSCATLATTASAAAVTLPKTIDFSNGNSLSSTSKGNKTEFSVKSASSAGATAMTDETNGNVLKLGSTGSGSTSYLGYTSEIGEVTEGAITLSYDLETHSILSSGNSNVVIQFTDSDLTPIFYVTSGTRGSSFLSINDSSQKSTSFKTLYKATADINFYNQTIDAKITSADGATTISSYTGDITAKDLKYLYYPNTNWKYGYVFLDNISIVTDAGTDTTITVTDTKGNALEGASVILGTKTLTTDANGQIVVSLPDGDYSYSVLMDGTAATETSEGTFTVAGATQTITAQLEKLAYEAVITSVAITGDDYTGYAEFEDTITYTAIVLDQENVEIPGEEIEWSVSPADSGVTIADGVVSITNSAAAGTYTVTAASAKDNSVSASKTITLNRVRDITYSGVDMITPFGGYVSESKETGISKQQIQGEKIVMEYDIYVPTGTSSSFTFYNSGNLGTQYIFNDSDGDGWVAMQYVTGGSGANNINSSDAYTGFYAGHWVHIKFEIPVAGNPGLGNTTVSVSAVDGDTNAFGKSSNGSPRYPYNNRTISARNLGSRLLNKIVYSGTATVTNLEMYTVAANVTIDAPNASIIGLSEGYIAQNTYNATITPDLGYEITGVTADGETIAANEDGTYTIVVDGDTAVAVTTSAKTDTWVFENIALNDWSTANIFFDYATPGVDGSTTVPSEINAITITNFLETYADKTLPEVSGEGEINFAITVLQDAENGEYLTDMWLKKPEGIIILSTGEFEADAEIDDSEYLEIGNSEFEVE